MPKASGPLDKEDLKSINLALRLIHDKLPALDRAEECGLPCQEFREHFEELRQKFTKIKQVYFSGQ